MNQFVLTMERTIHPGWVTRMYESLDGKEFFATHSCACGFVIFGSDGDMLQHTREKHPTEAFNLEIYRFVADLHALDIVWGLEMFRWPDRIPTEWLPR
jgi:hypothetical protein